MKVRAYVLIASVALLGMSAGSKKAKLTEGVNPGDLAPRIEFLGNDAKASFHNQLGRYTLLNFWAAYDAESRARNVQLANEVNKFGPDKIAMCSISMDEKESIFRQALESKDYRSVLKIFNEKGISKTIGHFLGIKNDEYQGKVINLLNGDCYKEIVELLSGYLPNEIPR